MSVQRSKAEAAEAAHDDYSLARVPAAARKHWFLIAIQRFGQTSALSQFVLGSTIGFCLKFWQAFWAVTLGAVVLEVVCIFVGIMGARQGLNTSLLARWSGFGSSGAALVGLACMLSLVGWFGIQSGVSATGLYNIWHGIPIWVWSIVFGLLITVICVVGFNGMQWVANITVPLFLILVASSVIVELTKHNVSALISSPPPGAAMSIPAAATLVAGGFMAGATITPDMSRFNRKASDVVKQTLVGITLGEYLICMSGVLLAHACKTADVTEIVIGSVGPIGIAIIVLGTAKINDWNLYASGLGVVNFIDVVFGKKTPRLVVTAILGIVGSVLAAVGILGHFTGFLNVLACVFPPIIGIEVAEYFFVKKWRPQLEEGREEGRLPATSPTWVPATLVIWVIAAVVSYFWHWGLASVNAIVLGFALYLIVGLIPWTRRHVLVGFGETKSEQPTTVAAEA